MRSMGVEVYQFAKMQNLAKIPTYQALYLSDSKHSLKPRPTKCIGSFKDWGIKKNEIVRHCWKKKTGGTKGRLKIGRAG